MSTIVTRSGKGSPLSHDEVDANFTNLNTDKLESVSEDTAPALGGNLNAAAYTISNVANIEVENTASINTIVGTGSGGINTAPRFPNGIDLDNSGIISSHDGSYRRVPITGGVDITNGSSATYNTEFKNTSSSGNSLLATVGTPGNVTTGGQLITARVATTSGYNTRFNVDYTGKMTINNAFSFPVTAGTNGQVLVTDGSGNLTWQTVSGASSTLDGLTDVTITSPSAGQALVYDANASVWINSTISGGSGIASLAEDTTPELGGDLDTSGESILDTTRNYIAVGDTGANITSALGSTFLNRSYGLLTNRTIAGWTGSDRIQINPDLSQITLGASVTGGTGRVRTKFISNTFDLNGYNFTTTGLYGQGLNTLAVVESTLRNTAGTAATVAQVSTATISGSVYSEGDNITITESNGLLIPMENYTENSDNTIGTQNAIKIAFGESSGFTGPTNLYSIYSDGATAKMYHAGPVQIGAYTLPTVDGSAGYVLTTNGSGTVGWAAAGSGGSGSFDGNLAGTSLQDSINNYVNITDPIKISTDTAHSLSPAAIEINLAKPIDGYPIYIYAANNEGVGDSVGGVVLDYRKDTSAVTSSVPRMQLTANFADVAVSSTTTPTQQISLLTRSVYYHSNDSVWRNRNRTLFEFGSDGFFNTGSAIVTPSGQRINFGVPVDIQEGATSAYVFNTNDQAIYSIVNGAGNITRNIAIDQDSAVSAYDAIPDSVWEATESGTYNTVWDQFWGFGVSWKLSIITSIGDFASNSTIAVNKALPPSGVIANAFGGTVTPKYVNTPGWANTSTRTVTMTRPASGTTFYKWTIEWTNSTLFIKDWETWTVS